MPYNKARNRELTTQQKTENKEFSSKRIFVEHVIRLVKIFQIARQRFPLNSRSLEQVIFTICGESALREGFPTARRLPCRRQSRSVIDFFVQALRAHFGSSLPDPSLMFQFET